MRLAPSHLSTLFNYLAKCLTLKTSARIKFFLGSRFWFITMAIVDRLGRNRWQKMRSNNKYRSPVVDCDTYFHGKRMSPLFKGTCTLFICSFSSKTPLCTKLAWNNINFVIAPVKHDIHNVSAIFLWDDIKPSFCSSILFSTSLLRLRIYKYTK